MAALRRTSAAAAVVSSFAAHLNRKLFDRGREVKIETKRRKTKREKELQIRVKP
jgi:hypothetical protein